MKKIWHGIEKMDKKIHLGLKVVIHFALALVFGLNSLYSQTLNENAKKEIRENLEIYQFLLDGNQNKKAGLQAAKIAVLYWNHSVYDSAIYFFNESINIFTAIEGYPELSSIYTNLGAVYSEQGRPRKAIQAYTKSYEITQQIATDREVSIKGVDLANAYSLNNQHKKAIELINQAVHYARNHEEHLLLLSCYSQLVKVYERKGDLWKAKEYKLRYNHYGDSVEGKVYNLNALLTQARNDFVEDSLNNLTLAEKTGAQGQNKQGSSFSEDATLSSEDFVQSRIQSDFTTREMTGMGIRYHGADSLGIGPVYRKVEKMPQFLEGNIGLHAYLIKNIPPIEFEKSVEYVVEFIVNKEGKVIHPNILKEDNNEIGKSILKAFSNMPEWIPGKTGNEKLQVYKKIKIDFPLEKLDTYLQARLNQLESSKESILDGKNEAFIGNLYFQFGVVYFYSNDFEKALENYNKALDIFEKTQDIDEVSRINKCILKLNEAERAYKSQVSKQKIMNISIIAGAFLLILIVVVVFIIRRRKLK